MPDTLLSIPLTFCVRPAFRVLTNEPRWSSVSVAVLSHGLAFTHSPPGSVSGVYTHGQTHVRSLPELVTCVWL